jgi:hypothetical protein
MLMQFVQIVKGVGVLSLTLSIVSGCATSLPGNFCDLYEPVYTSPQDTEETKLQVDINNAEWLATCEEE